ncbi:MAG: family 78 glycoside hydrolase catalytic domain [Oscillospiraceae bacterium]|jgi:alpha-L-rhamnosidase|nr:family 78 glycoside hydrolase catalytic domain [Oscillospiraceae bacterium]
MTHKEIFQNAAWVAGSGDYPQQLIRGKFSAGKASGARITITGLGFFECYINGSRVSNDKFVPAWTDYEKTERYEREHKMTDEQRHRVFCMEYDILPLLKEGENTIAVALGGGWYQKYYSGEPKLCFLIRLTDEQGAEHRIGSDTNLVWHPSYITESRIIRSEIHDYNIIGKDWFLPDFDASAWQSVHTVTTPEAAFAIQRCPADKVARTIVPKLLRRNKHYTVYDAGENITGAVVIKTGAPKGSEVELLFSEEIDNSGELSFDSSNCWGGRQQNLFITDGSENLTAKAEFMWNGFRYFSLTNNAEPLFVEVIHTDVAVASTWKSDSEILNWLNDAFLRTQLANMHAGIPSDCPHREGRGYTGDGQNTADAVMLTLNAKQFYEKWLEDIYDCQDLTTGHVQYTAPFVISGGGPGGWGGAVAIVPFTFYQHYGDVAVLKKFFPRIELFFQYLETHSENNLVVSDEPWAWCLGDWCTPEKITIPEPFVNNYFYVKTLEIYMKIAKIIGQEGKIPQTEATLALKKQAIVSAYFKAETGDFCENVQGANAFALDIGLGDGRTLQNMVDRYTITAMYDTGIFGTDIVTRVLFEKGYAQLAFDLLTSKERTSFHSQIIQGATTLWEYWDGKKSRSHPMFGAIVKYLYYNLLGIRQKEGTAGFSDIVIAPTLVDGMNYCEGSVKNTYLKYVKTNRDITFIIESRQSVTFIYENETRALPAGRHELYFAR